MRRQKCLGSLGVLLRSHQIRVRIPDAWLADLKIKKKSVLVTGCLSVMLLPNGGVGSAQWCPTVGPSQALTWHDANRFCSKMLHFGQEPAYSRSWAGGHLGRKRTRLYMD